MTSYQNLILLQNLYRLQAIGFEYIEHFNINDTKKYDMPTSIDALKKSISHCHLCDLSKSRKQSMSGYGDANANLLLIDYRVTQAQDANNDYYAGRIGETLKNMIEKVLLMPVESLFLTHCVKCKPLNSNLPSPSEVNSCKGYLYAQIEAIKPKVIVTLGEDAYTHLTQHSDNFENVRGNIIDYKEYKLIPIYHPQHLLRNPQLKRVTLNDLLTIKRVLTL